MSETSGNYATVLMQRKLAWIERLNSHTKSSKQNLKLREICCNLGPILSAFFQFFVFLLIFPSFPILLHSSTQNKYSNFL